LSKQHPSPPPEKRAKPVALPSAFALFVPSVRAMLLNLQTFVLLGALPLVMFVALGFTGGLELTATGPPHWDAVIPFSAGIIVAIFIISPAVVLVQLKSVRRQQIGFREAFDQGLHYFWRMLGLALLLAVIFVVSLILFVVPFFFMLRRYLLSPYYLVDRDLGIREAMRQSAAASKHHSGAVWGVIGVQTLLSIFNFVPILGQVVAVVCNAAYWCAPAARYNQMCKADKAAA